MKIQATTWDRAYGGSTVILHVEGTTIPGAPPLPEYLKSDVYLPPHLIDETPDCHRPIAAIVQTFIEEIGVPTVNRWSRAAHNLGWSLNQKGPVSTPSNHYPHLIPPPVSSGSAHYNFRGHPYGSLSMPTMPSQPSVSILHPSASSSATAPPVALPLSQASSSDIYFAEEPDSGTLALMDATEQLAFLKAQLERADQKEEEYQIKIADLQNELATTFAKLQKQEAILAQYTSRGASGSTSSSSQPPSPSPQHASPFHSVQSPNLAMHHVLPKVSSSTATPSKFPKVDVSKFPRLATLNLEPATPSVPGSSKTPCSKAKPKKEDELAAVTNLGPATIQFIVAYNLTHIAPMVALVVQHNPAPQWSTMLAALSLSDTDHSLLLEALTSDWMAGNEGGN